MYEKTVEAVRKNETSRWEIADALVAETPLDSAESAFEKAAVIIKALTAVELTSGTLRAYHRTASIFPPGVRDGRVSFTGHAEIATATAARGAEKEWLNKAATHGWSKRDICEALGKRSDRQRIHPDRLTEADIKAVIQAQPEAVGRAVSENIGAALSYERTARERAAARQRKRQDVIAHQRKTMGDERVGDAKIWTSTAAVNAARAVEYAEKLESYERQGAFESMSNEDLEAFCETIVSDLAGEWERAAITVRETVIRARAARAAFTV